LLEKGLEQKPRLLGLQRKEAELRGRIGELTSLIAKANEKIGENALNISNVRTEWSNEVETALKENQGKTADLEDNLFASSDIFKRTGIVAQQAGVVTGLRYHTIGGVVKPGEPILDIVPQDENLVIDVKLDPNDIDAVKIGDPAKALLSAYRIRFLPRIEGKVTHISPDRFKDEVSGEFYYKLTVEIEDKEIQYLREYDSSIRLVPGMEAQVFIVTGSFTLFQWLVSPLRATMRESFNE